MFWKYVCMITELYAGQYFVVLNDISQFLERLSIKSNLNNNWVAWICPINPSLKSNSGENWNLRKQQSILVKIKNIDNLKANDPKKRYYLVGEKCLEGFLTWVPPLIVSPTQTCFMALELLYQFLPGIFSGWARMHVSPVEKSQYTLIVSIVHPWLGSIQ